MWFLRFIPRWLTLGDRRSEHETKLRGEASYAGFRSIEGVESLNKSRTVNMNRFANRRFQFQKRSQLLIRPHDETLSVAAMRIPTYLKPL